MPYLSRPAAPGSTSTPNPGTSTPCVDWSTRECGVEVGAHDGVVDCARGVQVCENGKYGACVVDAARGTLSVPAPSATLPAQTGLGLQAVGGSATDCDGNVCNPYCQGYKDDPDQPYEGPRVDIPTGIKTGGTLQSSNVPPSFKTKGSLDAQCSEPTGSQEWNEACQFDQHCVNGQCEAFEPGEFGSCTGVDITAPTTCVPATGDSRVLTVCNRGTVSAPAGIKCYRYSGGSPQFPNDDPGVGDLLMTTSKALAPGECESQDVAESVFHQNGIQSVACNPYAAGTVTATLGPRYPSSNTTTPDMFAWTSPANTYAADDVYATAAPDNPNGDTTNPANPTSHASFGTDPGWTNSSFGYSTTPAGSYATAAPAAPALSSGSLTGKYPGGFINPASSSDVSFNDADRMYLEDGNYASVAPANPATPVVLSKLPSSNDGAAAWTNLGNLYTNNGAYATAKRTSAGSSDAYLSGFGLNVPSGAIVDSLVLRVKWKTDVNSGKYSLTAQAVTGALNTTIGSPLAKSSQYTTESTDELTIPASTLSSFSASDLNALRVRLRFNRASGNVADSTASVDFVEVVVTYRKLTTNARIAYRWFGLGGIPSNATVQLNAEVKWKVSAATSNVTLGLQMYKNYGAVGQATLGTELTRTTLAANTDYTDVSSTQTVSPADLTDTSFAIVLRVTRANGATNNPDLTAYIDYVRVTAVYSVGSSASTTHSMLLKGFGLDSVIPANATITGVTTTARYKLSTVNTNATFGVQAYAGNGTTALGTEATHALGPTVDTAVSQVIGAGVTRSQLSDSTFGVRVRISRSGAAVGNPDFTAYLDDVSVVVTWTSTSVSHGVTLANFDFGSLPSDALITAVKTEVRWKASVSTTRGQLGFRAFVGAGTTGVGSEQVPAWTTSFPATPSSYTVSGLSLTPSQVQGGNLVVKLRTTRSTGATNPDFTVYVDYVRVTLTYSHTVISSVSECNVSNNWTATKLNPSPDACQDMSNPEYVPFTVTRVFQGVCPTDSGVVWQHFAYTTSTPSDSQVQFRFRTFAADASGNCTALPAITSGLPAPLVTASATGDPAVCPFDAQTSECPVNLFEGLGKRPYATYECLQMDAYGTPTSSGEETPQLIDWNVYYDCMESQ